MGRLFVESDVALVANKVIRVLTTGFYPVGDGSLITNISGTANKRNAIFPLSGVTSSFSTGAFAFSPRFAFAIATFPTQSNMSFGFLDLVNGLASQRVMATDGDSGDFSSDLVQSDAGNTSWDVTAFSAAGLTLTRSLAVVTTITNGMLIVFEA
jgi:hypothetical protein